MCRRLAGKASRGRRRTLPSAAPTRSSNEPVSASSDLLLESPELAEAPVGGETIAARSPLQLFWRRFRKDRVAMVALAFIAVLLLIAIFHKPLVHALGLP